MIDARDVDLFHRPGLLPRAAQLGESIGLRGRNLRIEIALQDEQRLLGPADHLRRIVGEEAAEPRSVGLLAQRRPGCLPSRFR